MRVGMTIFCQNADDWDRYEAEERGEAVAARPAKSDQEIFREDVELAQMADGMGFDTVWTIEHHFTPYTMVTNPLQLLTYLSGVTKNVDLGTMVVVLPWHNPVRVAEDASMLHTLLNGRRLVLGVGRGLGRREFKGLGIDQNEARARFDENIQILRQLLRDGEIEKFDGEFYQIDHLRLRPQLEEDISDLLYCAAGSPETMQIIANVGVKPMIIPNTDLETALQGLHNYVDLREKAGFGPADTRLALWTYCAESEAEARPAAEKYMHGYADTALRHYELLGDHLKDLKGYEGYAQRSEAMRENRDAFGQSFVDGHPWGTPDMIIKRTEELAKAFGTSEITFVFRYSNMSFKEAEKSMRLFSKEVLPALKEINPAPLSSAEMVS